MSLSRYILRIYNNGNNSARVRFEHKVLKQLSRQTLSFQIPETLPSKSGEAHVLLSSGAEACVFKLISGKLPKTTSPKEIGRASGELNSALQKVALDDITGCAPPYYELYKVHHIVTRELFFREIASSTYDSCREPADFLVQQIQLLEEELGRLQESPPPPFLQSVPPFSPVCHPRIPVPLTLLLLPPLAAPSACS